MRETKREENRKIPAPSIFEKAINIISPSRAVKRYQSRLIWNNAKRYHGASKDRKSMSQWRTLSGDADTDTLADIPELRTRSRDLVRNNPLATGAINTKVSSVVGTGLVLHSQIDRNVLNLTDDQATKWESNIESEWRLFSESKNCDIARTSNMAELMGLAFRSVLEAGDVFILTPVDPLKNGNQIWPYQLRLQLVEADRVCNKDNVSDSENLTGGIKKDENGAPLEYHITKGHPGNLTNPKQLDWKVIPAYGAKTGRVNIIHLFHKKRVGQSRGVPDLAPVIELLKQLSRYSESEIARAVISSFFTVFVKTEQPGGLGLMKPVEDIGGQTSDDDFKMGSGAILDLAPNETVEFANPTSPNQSFDPFFLSYCRQIGVALELPVELLIKHFTSSFSAARASLIEAWRYFLGRRKWLADGFCNPIYELFVTEVVSSGRVPAPGFLTDPMIRKAYLGADWIGPAKGQIDEMKSVQAAGERVAQGFSTKTSETAALTGQDWEFVQSQRKKEIEKEKADGTLPQVVEPDSGGDN